MAATPEERDRPGAGLKEPLVTDAATQRLHARQQWDALDGLRAIAVLAVVVYHGSVGWAVNGYVGVDIFFALSGFLITWLLLAEIARTGGIRVGAFCMRRLLRLYPALLATLAVVVALAIIGSGNPAIYGAAAASAFYAANWWVGLGNQAPLLEHMWTLAIEEHFYFVWPFLTLLLTRRRALLRIAGIAMAVALAVGMAVSWPAQVEPVRIMYLRGAPIVWGSLLAWALTRIAPAGRFRPLITILAASASLALLALVTVPIHFPEWWLTGPVGAAGLLSTIAVGSLVQAPHSFAGRLLSWAPLTWIGRRAYGIYLYHFPIISLLMHQVDFGIPQLVRSIIGIGLSVLVAGISYRYLELPFLRIKHRYSTKPPSNSAA